MVVLDRQASLFSQIAVRIADPVRQSDADNYLVAGVSALTLSDQEWSDDAPAAESSLSEERLEDWIELVAAVVRQLDRLEGRPAADSEYLVLGGRVVGRRPLLWTGFLLWAALVWRGLPGRWRGRSSFDRRLAGRRYLPGFAFRMILLVAIFVTPTVSSLLLFPVAVCALIASGASARTRRVVCLVAVVPTVAFAFWLSVGLAAGWFVLASRAWLPAMLVTATLASLSAWLLDSAD